MVKNFEEIIVRSGRHIIAKIIGPIEARIEDKKQLKALRKNCKIRDAVSPIGEAWEVEK